MKNIFVIGAGKSATYLLEYLDDHAGIEDYHIKVADISVSHLEEEFGNMPHFTLLNGSADDTDFLRKHMTDASLVISMVPAFMHPKIARLCLELNRDLITPSYVSDELKAMDAEARSKGLLFLNEIGVDPGIDHMSAMQIIDKIKQKGAKLLEFESFCGGLIAPESDNNPWHYKFTWNPRNVILAGQGTAKFLQDGEFKYIPYHQLFRRIDVFEIEGLGEFEGYANRDSLKYIEAYGLHDIKTMYRGTFRRPPFCAAWDVFVQLGMTDDSYKMEKSEGMSFADYTRAFLPNLEENVIEDFCAFTDIEPRSKEFRMYDWLGLFDENTRFGIKDASPAQLLQHILERKWVLGQDDKDLLVMLHEFKYEFAGEIHGLSSTLSVIGEDRTHTAMAKTVGLPIAIAAKLILQGRIKEKGVIIPTMPSIYEPVLEELKEYGIVFHENGYTV